MEGKLRGAARLARVGEAGKLQRNKGGTDAVMELLRGFLEHEPAPIAHPQELAQRLARLTHMIRDIIIEATEGGHDSNTLRDLRKAFAQTLIPDVDQPERIADFADMGAVLEHFGKRTRRQPPVVHFYETFLAAYDPKLREARGVYFTPEPVVSYIVRSVDHLLRMRFGCEQGLKGKEGRRGSLRGK